MNGPFFILNGEEKPIESAVVPADDLSFAYGFGVYETLKVRKGILHFAEMHEERLFHSARILGLEHPWKKGDFQKQLYRLVDCNKIGDANLKALLIGGKTASDSKLYIMSLNPLFPDRRNYKDGATAITVRGERIFPQAKSLNMLVSYIAYREAQSKGAYDALLVDRNGFITEGTRTNFFVTDGQRILTPPAESVLEGVTKLTVCETIRSMGIPIVETPLPLSEISSWKSAFLTSTSTKVMPLRNIDTQSFSIDPIVISIMKRYDEFLDSYAKGKFSTL